MANILDGICSNTLPWWPRWLARVSNSKGVDSDHSRTNSDRDHKYWIRSWFVMAGRRSFIEDSSVFSLLLKYLGPFRACLGQNIEVALSIHSLVLSGWGRPEGRTKVMPFYGIQTINMIHRDMESLRWVGERRWPLTFSGGYYFAQLSWLRSLVIRTLS